MITKMQADFAEIFSEG